MLKLLSRRNLIQLKKSFVCLLRKLLKKSSRKKFHTKLKFLWKKSLKSSFMCRNHFH
ncbi:CLUMA_CG007352, isoform A [Clunio marinus]|uniref:CLUMA_CG007352, isoform A n=1 Tax=Clunio marinus TaxID=568069 RepID=A0A1J1I614_9DIPT|nr:CLUMA_CG007352, isoform A [Clunio marinus]